MRTATKGVARAFSRATRKCATLWPGAGTRRHVTKQNRTQGNSMAHGSWFSRLSARGMSVTWQKHDKHVVYAAASRNFISAPKCTSGFPSFLSSFLPVSFPRCSASARREKARTHAEKATSGMKETRSGRR